MMFFFVKIIYYTIFILATIPSRHFIISTCCLLCFSFFWFYEHFWFQRCHLNIEIWRRKYLYLSSNFLLNLMTFPSFFSIFGTLHLKNVKILLIIATFAIKDVHQALLIFWIINNFRELLPFIIITTNRRESLCSVMLITRKNKICPILWLCICFSLFYLNCVAMD